MKGDLWMAFAAVALLALAGALGGISQLRLEYARARVDLREEARARAGGLAQALFKRYSAAAGAGLPGKVDALASDVERDPGLAAAFVWRKGKGVIWTKGEEHMIIRDMDGSFKWVAEGNRAKYPKRGYFTQAGATVAWAKIGPKDVGGYVLDSRGVGPAGNMAAKFAAKACLFAVAACLLVAGGWYLRQAAARAREESDALVEMLRTKVENQEVEHVQGK